MRVVLKRIERSEEGVFGVLLINGKAFCVTLERPWKGNERNVSCVPAGIYQCKRILSPRFGDTFEILNVAARANILFHAGNTIKDSKGCVLLGSGYGVLDNQRGVVSSASAIKSFMKQMEGIDYFPLLITNP